MTIVHAKCFKFGFCFADRIVGSKIGFEFLDEESKIQKPNGFIWIQECGFETI